MDTKPLVVSFCLVWLGACAAPPSTQERTVRQGSERVERACTEKPSGYTDMFESGLKVKLPLGSTPEPQAESVLKRYIEQEPKGTPLGEDLQSYLFYICQMSNNGGFSQETTGRLIEIFLDRWPQKTSRINSQSDRMSQLSIEAVNNPFSRILQEHQPLPPRVARWSRIRINNVGRNPIQNVKLTVIKTDHMEGRFQLPVASIDNLVERPGYRPVISINLNPGEDGEFEAIIECNGIVTMKCPKGRLAIFAVDNGVITFVVPVRDNIEILEEFTVRVTGDGAAPIIKTFRVLQNEDGLITLREIPLAVDSPRTVEQLLTGNW